MAVSAIVPNQVRSTPSPTAVRTAIKTRATTLQITSDSNDTLRHIDLELAVVEDGLGAGLRGGGVAQRHADAGEQLVDAERLRQVIVRPQVERLHLLAFAAAYGQDDDGRGGLNPHRADDILSVHVGQPEVEEDQVRPPALVRLQSGPAGVSGLDLKTVSRQVGPQGLDNAGFVFDYEDSCAAPTGVRLDGACHAVSLSSAAASVW